MIRGIGTSKGIGIGHALIIDEPQIEAKTEIVSDTAAELRRYENVKKKFIADTQNIIEELKKKLKKNDKTSLVLQNQIYLIEDIEMNQQIIGFIENEHLCADAAVDRTCSLYADIFASLDSEVMNQRVADIEDLKHRILSMLSGNVTVDLSNLEPDTIIVAKQLHPSVTAAMDTKHVVGIIAEKGGETSHAAILARALEIPAVLSVKDACSKIADNESVIVDGEYGEVFLKPIEKTVQIYTKKKKEYQKKVKELKKYIDRETVTSDGYKVCLAANIGNEDDAVKGMKSGAEGVGLFLLQYPFYPTMLTFSERIWRGSREKRRDLVANLPAKGTKAWEAFNEFEDRLIYHRDRYFKSIPFAYVKQSEMKWRLIGPFNHHGINDTSFEPEKVIKEKYIVRKDTLTWNDTVAYGGEIQIRTLYAMFNMHRNQYRLDFLPTVMSSSVGKKDGTCYALTRIKSPKNQEVYLMFGLNGMWGHSGGYRSARAPEHGSWDFSGGDVWLNGIRVLPPSRWPFESLPWTGWGKGRIEVPLTEEGYFFRPPVKIKLRKGVNEILVRTVFGHWKGDNGQRKWQFCCMPVLWNGCHYTEVKGLEYLDCEIPAR